MFVSIDEMPESARIWIYQTDRFLTEQEASALTDSLITFCEHWTAHKKDLKASAALFHRCLLVLAVDETQQEASGCSVDKSVNFLHAVEEELGVGFFDRYSVAWKNEEGELQLSNKEEFETLVRQDVIQAETPVFNNLLQTIGQLRTNWEVPFSKSWHSRLFSTLV